MIREFSSALKPLSAVKPLVARVWRGRWRPLTAAFLLASLLAGCVVYPAYGPPPRPHYYYYQPYYGYYGR
jgi:hypothetical protein